MRRLHPRRGFTLIEVMVALVMFAIGSLGMAALTAFIMRANRSDTNRTRASASIRQKIEEFQSLDYDLITSGADVDTLGGVVFDRTWTVTPDSPAELLSHIELVATWSDADGEHRVTTETIRAFDGGS